MTIIEDANKYLHEKPTAYMTKDRKIEKSAVLIERLVKEIGRRDEVIDAAKNLEFTARKLWDEVKPIKDTDSMKVTHPMIEEFNEALSKLEDK